MNKRSLTERGRGLLHQVAHHRSWQLRAAGLCGRTGGNVVEPRRRWTRGDCGAVEIMLTPVSPQRRNFCALETHEQRYDGRSPMIARGLMLRQTINLRSKRSSNLADLN